MSTATDLKRTAQTVAKLDQRMAAAVQERDEMIRAMRANGATLREIAAVAGISHVAVSNIIAKGQLVNPQNATA